MTEGYCKLNSQFQTFVQRLHGSGNMRQRVDFAFSECTKRGPAVSQLTALMVKLTPELLGQAPSALNPIKERQLDLRGEQ